MISHLLSTLLHRRCAVASAIISGCCLMLLGCSSGSNEVTLFVSGDTQGWITPCGCASNQSGGLPRRGSVIRSAAESSAVIYLDAGGTAAGVGPYQSLKFQSVLEGMQAMGLELHNIGASETRFSPQELNQLAAETGVQWVSANLVAADGTAVGVRSQELKRGAMTMRVIGIIDPQLVDNQQWNAQEPVQAVLRELESSTARVNVVLAYFDEGGLRQLAESLPEVDYIIGGPTGQCMAPTKIGPVTALSVTNKGKFLGRIKLVTEEKGFRELQANIVEVSSDLPEAQPQLTNLETYHARLADKDFTPQESQLVAAHLADVAQSGYSVAGSAACKVCHQLDDQVWHSSKHSHAFEVLVTKNSHFDPHCQQCHTTGYGLDGGFLNVAQSRARIHVGCENCHGPSQAHVEDPRKKTPFQAKEQCIRCHDHENSPAFDLPSYWAKIVHQGNPPVPPSP